MNAPANTQVLIAAEVSGYVQQFNTYSKRSVESYLEMCHVVFDAKRKLSRLMFEQFCTEIKLEVGSSSISKMTMIGSKYDVLFENRDQLPAAWTTIYPLATLPKDVLREKLTDKTIHQGMNGKDAKALVPPKRKRVKHIKTDLEPFFADGVVAPTVGTMDSSVAGSVTAEGEEMYRGNTVSAPDPVVSPLEHDATQALASIAGDGAAVLAHQIYVFKVKGQLSVEQWDELSDRLLDVCGELSCDLFEFDKE